MRALTTLAPLVHALYTQAGSSVHSLSSVMSHLENNSNQPGQRAQWSSDGNTLLPAAAGVGGSSSSSRKGSFSSLTQQQQQSAASRSWRSSTEAAGSGQHTAAPSPGALQYGGGTSAAASPSMTTTDFDLSEPGDSPRAAGMGYAAGQSADGMDGSQGRVAGDLQRKNSLKGAFKAVTRWGSGISQRLQRTASSGSQQQPQQHELEREQWLVQQGSLPSSGTTAAGGGQELASLRRHVTG